MYAEEQDTPLRELCRNHPDLLAELEENIKRLRIVGRYLNAPDPDSQLSSSPGSPDVMLADEPPPAKILGRYELVDVIGRGGNARVWKAYDLRLQRHVAVKFPRGRVAASRDACELFLNEARKLALLVPVLLIAVGLGVWQSEWLRGPIAKTAAI